MGNDKKTKADGRICNIFENEDAMIQYYENREANLAALNMGKRVKLLKKVFLNLPEGSSIVSNSGRMDAPYYSSEVVAKNGREQQWQEIGKQKLQGTIFVILQNQKEKEQYLAVRANVIQDQMNRKSINFAF